jgi:transcription initiation factor TFIIIB Brf1 subunit/transcription initiation factor TFIIB
MSQTVCSHCGSTNSIETAGQRYCADCGQLIAEKAKKAEKKPEKKQEEKQKPVTSKHKAKPKKVAPPLNLKAIEESRTSKKPVHKQPGTLDLRQAAPKQPAKKPIGRHVAPKAVVPAQAPEIALEPVIAEPPIAQVHISSPAKRFRVFKAYLQSITLGFSGKSLPAALGAIVVIAISQAVYLSVFTQTAIIAISESFADASITLVRGVMLIDHLAWAILASLLGYVAYQYAVAKITYRNSIEYDRRNGSNKHVRQIALCSLFGLTSLDMINSIAGSLLITATVIANIGFIGTKSLGWIGIALALIINCIAIYVLLGMLAARLMGANAVIVGQAGVRRAYATGWALYTRQFGIITSGIIVMILASVLFIIPLGTLYAIFGVQSMIIQLVLAIVAVGSFAALTAATVIYAARLYQFVVSQVYEGEARQQLSGSDPSEASTGRRLMAVVALLLIVAASMVGLILNAYPIATAFIR